MDDELTRDLLRQHAAWGVRPGARVVFHEAIEAAGADVEAFGRYIEKHGGSAVEPHGRPYWLLPDHL